MDVSLTLKQIDTDVQRVLAKHDFWEYCLWHDQEFFEKRVFLKKIADLLQWLHDEYVQGRPRRVQASLPPRAGKSYIMSLFCAWWLGRFPELSVMRNTCTARLYEKFSRDVRAIVTSDKYLQIFPNNIMSPYNKAITGWSLMTARQVSYFGAGVGGTIIGFGANLAASDDLYRGLEDALSETYNETVITWKESAHDSRKERNCPEAYIGTRWSKRDVIGKAIEDGLIDRAVVVPALTEDGETFCDEVKTTEEYIAIRDNIDEVIWQAEYMQEPIESVGLLFPMSELGIYNPEDLDLKDVEYAMAFADPADKGGDYFSVPIGLFKGGYIYIHDVIFSKDGTDVVFGEITERVMTHKLNELIVEGNGGWHLAGKQLRQLLGEKAPDCRTMIINATANKETRILAQSAFIKNHFMFRSDWKGNRQYMQFMNNLTGYNREGGNKHDDAPDGCAGLAFMAQRNVPHYFK